MPARILAVCLLLASPAAAQELFSAPVPQGQMQHRFLDRVNLGLLTADAGAKAADAYWTHALFVPPQRGTEYAPLSRIFVTHGTPRLAGYFAAELAGDAGLAYWLHRRHHYRMEKVVMGVGILQNGGCAAYTATHIGK